MSELERDDIQGIIFRGYATLPAAYLVLLRIEDGQTQRAKNWLKNLASDISNSESVSNRTEAVQVAFTLQGLRKLGLKSVETRFSCEFEEGMTPGSKQRTLGDHGESDPAGWAWGGTQDDAQPIDVLLMLYAVADHDDDGVHIDALYERHRVRFEDGGLGEVKKLSTRTLIERKEHFGFADGIAQPILGGTPRASRPGSAGNVIASGEFILGHKNEYDKYPQSPSIPASSDLGNLLPTLEDGTHDLGHNGSYLVFRQLSQDVKAFWEFLDKTTKSNGRSDPEARDLVAAKMVGRWRSGVALMQSPDKDDPDMAASDSFAYLRQQADGSGGKDQFGQKCPLGSHIRRTNPRDSVFPGTDEPLTMSNVHRILRRGRAFGPPLAASMQPDDILAAEDTGEERGLHFICFNTDIGRQFEFVQHTWANNPKFASMYRELDPLIGDHGKRHRESKGTFTIPAKPVRKRITGVTRYVNVLGGAYFFLPGIKALKVLADLP